MTFGLFHLRMSKRLAKPVRLAKLVRLAKPVILFKVVYCTHCILLCYSDWQS